MSKPFKVLFVGNSYTYYHDSPQIFKNIATADGFNVEVYSVTKGGWTLEQMADEKDEFGFRVDELLNEIKFDAVVLQEQSTRPILEREKFHSAVKKLAKKVAKNGASLYLYQTWGRNDGSPDLERLGETRISMTEKIKNAYEKIAQIVGATVSPVGSVYDICKHDMPQTQLYDDDCSHPSAIGSYLVALTHYSTIFKKLPFNVKFRGSDNRHEQEYLEKAVITEVYPIIRPR